VPLDERLASRVLAKFRSTAGEGEEACTGLTGYVGRAEPRVASQHAMLFDVAVGSSTEQLQQMRRSAFTNSIYLGAREDGGPQWGKISRPPRVPVMAGLAETGQPLG
jgi:hypothetical protein